MRGINLKLSYGTQIIYDDACFNIPAHSKVGIVGVNGAGKTTLFKVILGQLQLESGTIIKDDENIGYLPQEIDFAGLEMTVWDYLYSSRGIDDLKEQLTNTYMQLAKCSSHDEKRLLKKAARLQDRLDVLGEYDAEQELLELIEKMNIDVDLLDMKVSTLSGGQKSKIAFAHLLFSASSLILLDEPTNHLDSTTKEFITNYLKNYSGGELIISHDIDFLNAVVDKILFIDKVTHKMTVYDGNYTDFKRQYAREMSDKENRIVNQEREIAKLEAFIKRTEQASATNHKLKRLGASRKKMLESKLAELETRDKTYKRVNMKTTPKREIGKVPLEVTRLTFAYPEKKELYRDLSFTLTKNEKFLIVGENGIGKSTLLKLLMNRLTPKTGSITFNQKADIAYYAQELEILDEEKTILENVKSIDYSSQELRSWLGNFLFYGNDVDKKVGILSPGEKARVALCKTLLTKANFIILDEPTNHFDPETQNIIGENFQNFEGTLILVSHNPAFVESIGITRMLVLPEGKILNYSKELLNYYYYLNTDLV